MATASYRDTAALRLLRELTRAAQAVTAISDAWTAGFHLTPGEFDIVMALGNTPGLRMCDLAASTLTTPPNITRLVKSLEDRGFVERQRNPDSEREVIARLTPAGEELFDRAYPATYAHWREHLNALYNPGEQDRLIVLLGKLAAARSSPP